MISHKIPYLKRIALSEKSFGKNNRVEKVLSVFDESQIYPQGQKVLEVNEDDYINYQAKGCSPFKNSFYARVLILFSLKKYQSITILRKQ